MSLGFERRAQVDASQKRARRRQGNRSETTPSNTTRREEHNVRGKTREDNKNDSRAAVTVEHNKRRVNQERPSPIRQGRGKGDKTKTREDTCAQRRLEATREKTTPDNKARSRDEWRHSDPRQKEGAGGRRGGNTREKTR